MALHGLPVLRSGVPSLDTKTQANWPLDQVGSCWPAGLPHLAVFTETRWASLPWTGEGSYTFFMYEERPFFLLSLCTPACIQVSTSGGGQQQAKEGRSILLKGLPPFII